MKLILKEEVDNLGYPGDVVDVADGYGRNFLVPRGLAIRATPGAMKEAKALTRARKAREAETLDDAQESKQALEARDLRIEARVDEHGTLYGSVGPAEIQTVLKERGHTVERRRVDLPRPIKTIGEHEVNIRVHPQVTATLNVVVVDVEGEVTVESLAEQRMTEAERRAVLEEEALEAAEEIETEEAEAEAVEPEAVEPEADVEDQEETGGQAAGEPAADEAPAEERAQMSTAEALAARASAPTDVDAPARPEDMAGDETEDEKDTDDEEPDG